MTVMTLHCVVLQDRPDELPLKFIRRQHTVTKGQYCRSGIKFGPNI